MFEGLQGLIMAAQTLTILDPVSGQVKTITIGR